MDLRPVHTPTKSEAAYHALRSAIRNGELRPGQRVTLNELAGSLEMSLTPVREALRHLASQGLVEQQPNRGTVIAEYTLERAREIYRLRRVLEPLAAELSATHATEDDHREIAAALEDLDRAVSAGRDAEVPALNAVLHNRIYAAARSPYLLEFIDKLWNGVPFQAISLADRQQRSGEQHHAIVRAVVRGDPAEASRLMHEHISEAAEETFRQFETAGGEGTPAGGR
ncbi:GntR family transcriptional regulator [Salinifilum ghardaiensis]